MPSPIHLTEAVIHSGASRASFERGKQYYGDGVISDASISGNTISALCRGNSAPHYKVRAVLDDAGVQYASCTCEYDLGGYCKHIVALLLTYIHNFESFEPLRSPQDLLSALDRDEMAALLVKLMQKSDAVQRNVEKWVAAKDKSKAPTHGKRTGATAKRKPVDTTPYRQHLRTVIRGANETYNPYNESENEDVTSELDGMRQSIGAFLEAGEPDNALAIVSALMEESANSQKYSDNDIIELEDFLSKLDLPLAEAVLSQDLDAGTLRKVLSKVENNEWQFAASIAALKDG